MKNLLQLAQVAVLFQVLTPGVLVSIPAGASRTVQAAVHAVVFVVVLTVTKKFVKKLL